MENENELIVQAIHDVRRIAGIMELEVFDIFNKKHIAPPKDLYSKTVKNAIKLSTVNADAVLDYVEFVKQISEVISFAVANTQTK